MTPFSAQKPLTLFQSKKESSLHEASVQPIFDVDSILQDQDLFNSISGMVVIKDLYSRLIKCNRSLSINAGLSKPEDIYMKSDLDMIWNEGNLTPSFLAKDKVINNGMSQLNIGRYLYKDGFKTLLIRRFPIFKHKAIAGNITILHEVSEPTVEKIIHQSYVLGVKIDNHTIIEQMENCFITPNPLDKLNLTARERDVLYWLIRLDSAKEIAKKMHKSHHTIYDIIGQIKNKLQVANIGELREKVFDTGLIHKLLK